MAIDSRAGRRRRFEMSRSRKSLRADSNDRYTAVIEWSSSDENESSLGDDVAIRIIRPVEEVTMKNFTRHKERAKSTNFGQRKLCRDVSKNSIRKKNNRRNKCDSSTLNIKKEETFKNDSTEYTHEVQSLSPILSKKTPNSSFLKREIIKNSPQRDPKSPEKIAQFVSPILGNTSINWLNKNDPIPSTSPILGNKLQHTLNESCKTFRNDLQANLNNPEDIKYILDCLEQDKDRARNVSPTLELNRVKRKLDLSLNNTKEPSSFVEYFSHTFEAGKMKTSQVTIGSFHSPKVQSLESNRQISAVSNLTNKIESISSIEPTPDLKIIKSITPEKVIYKHFEKYSDSLDSATKKRKHKFPKFSLADRLSKLIKKQTSSLSLWRHENYMADHTTFEKPAEMENALNLKIVGQKEEYGIYALECKDQTKDESYRVIFNCLLVNEISFKNDSLIKIWQPFKVFDIKKSVNCKVVVNVCKFNIINN